MTFDIQSNLETRLIRWFQQLGVVDRIVWLTYNIRVGSDRITRILSEARAKERLVVCGRLSHRSAGTHRVLARAEDITRLGHSGWDVRALDGLHAKGVFAWKSNRLVAGVVGSFNLSAPAILGGRGQFESIGELGAEQLGNLQAWFARVEGSGHLLELKREWYDASSRDPYSLDASSAATSGYSLAASATDNAKHNLADVLDTCIEKLRDWPPGKKTEPSQVDQEDEPFQVDLLTKLWEQSNAAANTLNYDRWLLHLPVGLGKTYIALAYAIKAIVERERSAKVLYLTPNRWVSESVAAAARDLSIPHGLVRVTHPEGLTEDPKSVEHFGVVILDEIQNWRARFYRESEPKQTPTYTHWVERVLEHNRRSEGGAEPTTVLALSATPYRFASLDSDRATSWQNYAIQPFLSRFLVYPSAKRQWRNDVVSARPLVEQLASPLGGWTLDLAADEGLLAPFKFKALDEDKLEALKAAMSEDGEQFEFGRWTRNLKRTWRAAVASVHGGKRNVDLGLKEVARAIAANLPHNGKGIVFLPIACQKEREVIRKELVKQKNLHQGRVFDATSDKDASPDQIVRDLKAFQKVEPPALLLAVNRLTEGVSLPEVNALFMLRPTRSPLIVMQQLGRGVRLQKGKEKLLMVYDLAQAEEAYEKLSEPAGRMGVSERTSATASRVQLARGSRREADDRNAGTVSFEFEGATYWVKLSTVSTSVTFSVNNSETRDSLEYTHLLDNGRWTLRPKDSKAAWPITIESRDGSWHARVEDARDSPRGKAGWRKCTVIGPE